MTTTRRNHAGFALILVLLAIILVGMAVTILSQMSSDILLDAKQSQQRAIQRNEMINRRTLDH
ncbi:MAG: hypothetical protein JXA11_06680 [Phycisphaerae bacterium]|nr:hypothetical protein [Phycisphaerae bacterium]